MSKRPLSLTAFHWHWARLGLCPSETAEGFIEGSTLSLIAMALWAGLMAFFESGYTQGSVGIGVDAFAMLGLKLDSGSGRSGAGGTVDLLPQ